jgi:ribonuclease HI
LNLKKIEIVTDSNLIVMTMNKWLPVWKKNGFKTSKNKDVCNAEYIKLVDVLLQEFDSVRFVHVKGHGNSTLNNLSDSLSSFASHNYTLQTFSEEFVRKKKKL